MIRGKVIASYCLSNTASINVYDLDDESVFASLNDQDPLICPIGYEDDPDDPESTRVGFYFGEMFVPFNEVMRV